MSLPYLVYSWAWPDADEADLDIIPIDPIGVASTLEYAIDVAIDDMREIVDDVENSIPGFVKEHEVSMAIIVQRDGMRYDLKIPNFRWTWSIMRARATSGI